MIAQRCLPGRPAVVLAAVATVLTAVLSACASSSPPAASPAVTALARTASHDSCPATADVSTAVSPPGSSQLEPIPASLLLICGYRRVVTAGGPVESLAAHTSVTDPATIDSLRHDINVLPGPTGASVSCPADRGGIALLIFSDGSRAAELNESLTGCQHITDGSHTGWITTSDVGVRVMALLPRSFCTTVWLPAACK